MAGIQSCIRKGFTTNSLRLLNKNGAVLQSTRNRHFLVFRVSHPTYTQNISKTRLILSANSTFIHRFASTDVGVKEEISVPTPNSDVEAAVSGPVSEAVVSNETNIVIDEASLPPVPAVESSTQDSTAFEFISTGLKEPSFESLGLGSYWPSGIIQQVLEFLHINCDLPWWGAISIVTIVFRSLLFPLTVMGRKNAVRMNNNLPQMQLLQLQLSEARQTGNYYDAALKTQELMEFMKNKKIGTIETILPSLAQAPVFLSMYFALKQMSSLPVESLKTGGLFWFQDLTVPDPYYLLPVITASTLFLILEFGAEGVSSKSPYVNWMKYALRGIPFLVLPFSVFMPGAILWYWTVSNFITLSTVGLFKIKPVKKYFDIGDMVKHDYAALGLKQRKGISGFREGLANAKLIREVEERERLNTVVFEKAGREPVQRTFKKNPKETQQKNMMKLSQKQ